MSVRSILLEVTSQVTVINDSVSLRDPVQNGDILLIDGEWSRGQPINQLSSDLKNIILNGDPTLLMECNPFLLKKAMEGEGISHGWGDNCIVHGIKYSSDFDYSVTFGVSSPIITDIIVRNAILDSLYWAAKNIPDDLVKIYDGPFHPLPLGATSEAY